jgi:hypothetical protein
MNQESVHPNPPNFNGVAPAAPVDELAFGLLMNRTLGGSASRRPSDKSANDVQVACVTAASCSA